MSKCATVVQQRIRPAPPPQMRRDLRMPGGKQVRQDKGVVEPARASTVGEHWDYGLDVWQRTILFWDALRRHA